MLKNKHSKHLKRFLYTPYKLDLTFQIGGGQKRKKMFAMFAEKLFFYFFIVY